VVFGEGFYEVEGGAPSLVFQHLASDLFVEFEGEFWYLVAVELWAFFLVESVFDSFDGAVVNFVCVEL
jgi:hypothetical protein